MRRLLSPALVGALLGGLLGVGCAQQEATPAASVQAPAPNVPPLSENNIVSIATRSPDHTTLVAAIKAADYVTSVAASGPLTVFAPTDEAFAKLPAGTVENLVLPENVETLRDILRYHVTTSAIQLAWYKDGDTIAMANGKRATMGVKDGAYTINGANIVATIPAENGVVYVVDAVLLPPDS